MHVESCSSVLSRRPQIRPAREHWRGQVTRLGICRNRQPDTHKTRRGSLPCSSRPLLLWVSPHRGRGASPAPAHSSLRSRCWMRRCALHADQQRQDSMALCGVMCTAWSSPQRMRAEACCCPCRHASGSSWLPGATRTSANMTTMRRRRRTCRPSMLGRSSG